MRKAYRCMPHTRPFASLYSQRGPHKSNTRFTTRHKSCQALSGPAREICVVVWPTRGVPHLRATDGTHLSSTQGSPYAEKARNMHTSPHDARDGQTRPASGLWHVRGPNFVYITLYSIFNVYIYLLGRIYAPHRAHRGPVSPSPF